MAVDSETYMAVCDQVSRLQSELTAARDEAERLRRRVAMLEEFAADAQMDAWRALDPDYVPPAVESAMKSLLHRAATITQEVDPDDIEPNAWLLRKQAEAVERLASHYSIKSMSGNYIWKEAAIEEATRLLDQADSLESGE